MGKLFLVRHEETEWALSGRHTGKTDIPLTETGLVKAKSLGSLFRQIPFSAILSSPMQRAWQSCCAAGFENLAQKEPLLMEWDYGQYEGLTTAEIHKTDSKWDLFCCGAPNGESPTDVRQRAENLLKKVLGFSGNVLLFSHGHFLRSLAAVFITQNLDLGRYLVFSPGALSILGFEKKQPSIFLWNQPR
jgi:broad specificity phosphatase PhoE